MRENDKTARPCRHFRVSIPPATQMPSTPPCYLIADITRSLVEFLIDEAGLAAMVRVGPDRPLPSSSHPPPAPDLLAPEYSEELPCPPPEISSLVSLPFCSRLAFRSLRPVKGIPLRTL